MAGIAADLVVILHFAFVAFAALGGWLVVHRPRTAWLHLPCVAWAAYVEFTGTICPLTPIENRLRAAANLPTYDTGFIERYLLPILYPPGLTSDTQLWLGAALVAMNVAAYAIALRRRVHARVR